MKIAISSAGKDIHGDVDSRFGRAKGFIIYNLEKEDFFYIDNEQNLNAAEGAGIQSAKTVIDTGVKILITGNVGPKAFKVLKSAGVSVMVGARGTIEDAVLDYKNDNLEKAEGANVQGHWQS